MGLIDVWLSSEGPVALELALVLPLDKGFVDKHLRSLGSAESSHLPVKGRCSS